MQKRVILVTGTPAVGKTTLAKQLAEKLNAHYVNLTELAQNQNLIFEEDKQRNTTVIDEAKMRRKLKTLIQKAQSDVVVDGHYAAAVTPKTVVTNIFVLRRNPAQLRLFMQKRGYTKAKQDENLQAEILDVCLIEALQKQEKDNVCELDITGKSQNEALNELIAVLNGERKCYVGTVDWMGLLEREGKLDEYLKP